MTTPMNKRVLQLVTGFVLLSAIAAGIYYRDNLDVNLIAQSLEQAGWWAPIIFILIYVVATVFFLPGSLFTLAGGVIFGPVLGVVCNLTGATIGAALSFLIARYLAADVVSKRSAGRLKQLINGVEAEGWRFVALVRLVPLFPFNLLNYALGLTRIRFSEYVAATTVFMIPGAIAYTYIGYAGREAVSGGEGFINNILIALSLLAVVVFLPRFIATIRRGPSIDVTELKRRLEQQQTLLLDVRTSEDFEKDGHIQQAVNIPVEVLEQQLSQLEDHLDKSISIICRTDKRSAQAANLLLKHGYHDIRVVQGGMTDWAKNAYPL